MTPPTPITAPMTIRSGGPEPTTRTAPTAPSLPAAPTAPSFPTASATPSFPTASIASIAPSFPAASTAPAGFGEHPDGRPDTTGSVREDGSLVTEYGLLAVVAATVAGVVIQWASGGAVVTLFNALLRHARGLVGA